MAQVYTVEEAAAYLQVSPYTIRKWIRKGRINGRKIGRIYRILASELERLMAQPVELAEPACRLKASDVLGRFLRPGRSLDDFLRDQRREAEEEESKWQKEHEA